MTDDRPQPADASATADATGGRPQPVDGSTMADTTDVPAPAAEDSIAASVPDLVPRLAEPAVLRVWASVELAIGAVAVAVIFVSVLWQVVSRYMPALNWPGVGELANYSLIVLTFITVGYLIGNNGHITIQVIDFIAKGRAMVVVKAVSAACTAVICALLAWEAIELILAYPNRRTAALEIPIWILYAFPLVGFASGTVRAVVRIFMAGHDDVVFNAAEVR
jgi:TRAP-type C4-dicarboxylate transport system permease small subunit